MSDITEKNFGFIIAFLLPGFIFVWGFSYSSSEVALWLKSTSVCSPTVGGFLYVTLATLSLGLLISAVRWATIDQIHHRTRIKCPALKFANLKDMNCYTVFQAVVENHYRYYQYYANSLVAIVLAFSIYVVTTEEKPSFIIWAVVIAISVALFFGSRDALDKYYKRASEILL